MGRNMFGGGRGPWGDDPWRGWWGDDPPFHVPVFVLTHHERDPLPLEGGTTFTFVTDGIESALEQARGAAGVEDVVIGGGADVIRQYLAAGLVDELSISLSPSCSARNGCWTGSGCGDRARAGRAVAAPGVTHLRYRVVR